MRVRIPRALWNWLDIDQSREFENDLRKANKGHAPVFEYWTDVVVNRANDDVAVNVFSGASEADMAVVVDRWTTRMVDALDRIPNL